LKVPPGEVDWNMSTFAAAFAIFSMANRTAPLKEALT
jgi:hypothetical protein